MFEIIFEGNERVFQAEKRASYTWQRDEHMQSHRELKMHDKTENQGGMHCLEFKYITQFVEISLERKIGTMLFARGETLHINLQEVGKWR